MNPVRAFQLFLLRVLAVGAVAGYLVSLLQPSKLPLSVRRQPYAYSIAASFVLQLIYSNVIYPRYFWPLRDLPTVSGVSTFPFGLALFRITRMTPKQDKQTY